MLTLVMEPPCWGYRSSVVSFGVAMASIGIANGTGDYLARTEGRSGRCPHFFEPRGFLGACWVRKGLKRLRFVGKWLIRLIGLSALAPVTGLSMSSEFIGAFRLRQVSSQRSLRPISSQKPFRIFSVPFGILIEFQSAR